MLKYCTSDGIQEEFNGCCGVWVFICGIGTQPIVMQWEKEPLFKPGNDGNYP